MNIDFMRRNFAEYQDRDAIVWCDQTFTYSWLLNQINTWRTTINENNLPHGAVVILEADFSPNAVALFLALVEHQCILVPLTSSVETKKAEFIEIAQGEYRFSIDETDQVEISKLPYSAANSYYQELRQREHPGLLVFSSGSTGKSKAAVHDMIHLLAKFESRRRAQRAISFLLYDHIGGINTMLHMLSNGGCLITVPERTPDSVLRAVEKHHVAVLPVTPTFLNLILLSEAYKRYDLSSLEIVTYGTEPMPESTLKRFHELFPNTVMLQMYGLSEIGIMRTKSKSSDSLWMKIGGEGFETRIVDGTLQIKAHSAMLGYLNAPSPFTEDGWFNTDDLVEVDGEYMRVLGRKSELINVGGEKVYPAEVESVIQEMENVAEATVYGEKNAITGNIVCARVRLVHDEGLREFTRRLRSYCRTRLQAHKIPIKVTLVDERQYSERFKKQRKA